jgi:hypothetical protein
MHQHRFDAFARALAGLRSRRETVSLLGAVVGLLTLEPIAIPGANAQGEICLTGDERCRRGSQCCSGECKKKRRKKGKKKNRGRCVSLGQFAANCPPTDVCNLSIPPTTRRNAASMASSARARFRPRAGPSAPGLHGATRPSRSAPPMRTAWRIRCWGTRTPNASHAERTASGTLPA